MAKEIFLDGIVGWDITAQDITQQLAESSGDITFHLNSPGGYVTQGVAILNAIRNYKKGKTCANISYAASMMTQIALACDEVNVYDNGIFMIHNVQGIVYGDHNEQRKQADLQERMSNMLAQLYVSKTGKSLEEIKQLMDAETYLFGEEIVAFGFADSVITTASEQDRVMAMSSAESLNERSIKAMEEEALSLSALEDQYKMCSGNCTLGATPTADNGDKSTTYNQGAEMAGEKSLLGMLQARLGIGTDKTELQAVEELEVALKASNEALETANTALATQTEMADALTVKLADAEASKAETIARLEEAKQQGVSAEVALAMVMAETHEEASRIAIDSKSTNGATAQGEGIVNTQDAEIAYAVAFAKKQSVK